MRPKHRILNYRSKQGINHHKDLGRSHQSGRDEQIGGKIVTNESLQVEREGSREFRCYPRLVSDFRRKELSETRRRQHRENSGNSYKTQAGALCFRELRFNSKAFGLQYHIIFIMAFVLVVALFAVFVIITIIIRKQTVPFFMSYLPLLYQPMCGRSSFSG